MDTSIWIDWRRNGFDGSLLPKKPVRILLAAPVLAELELGRLKSQNKHQLHENSELIRFVRSVSEFVGWDSNAALEYAYLKSLVDKAGRPRTTFDLMIAAIARLRRAEVLTRDASANFPELLALPQRPYN